MKGFGCWSKAVVCIQRILNAYWGLRNFVVLYACCSQKPLTQNSVLIFFPKTSRLPLLSFFLNKLFTPPQNCDTLPRHLCCLWSIPSCLEGEEGDNHLVYSMLSMHPRLFSTLLFYPIFSLLFSLLTSSTLLFLFSFSALTPFPSYSSVYLLISLVISSPVLPSWLLSLMWLFCVSVLFCVCILDNRVSQLWLIFYWLNEKLSAKLK